MSATPCEIEALRAALAAAEARASAAEADAARARAVLSSSDAMIAALKLEIEKLRRGLYGTKSERKARLLEQLELQLEELEATATEDQLAAERLATPAAAPSPVTERGRPVRKPFPAHLPRERVVVAAPETCTCCGSGRIVKLGEEITETLEVIPRRWKVIQTVREKFTCRDCERISQPPFAIVLEPMAHDGSSFHPTPRGWAGPNLLATILFESEPLWRHWFKPNGERPASAAEPAGGAVRPRRGRPQPLDARRPGRRLRGGARPAARPDRRACAGGQAAAR